VNAEYFNRIVSTYGIGVDEFLDLFAAQGHACAICQCPLVLFSTDPNEQPMVDHDHVTGAVRGILCRTDNFAVGWLEKDLNRTKRVIGYVTGSRTYRPDLEEGTKHIPFHKPSREESSDWTVADWKAWRHARRDKHNQGSVEPIERLHATVVNLQWLRKRRERSAP
jgi:hypothetical protein